MDVRVIQEETIYENRTSALIRLNTILIEPGVSYSIRYKSGSKVDTLFALGTASGQGPGCYSLVSDQSMPCIAKILFEMPDVSELIYGQVYLLFSGATWKDEYEEEGIIIDVEMEDDVEISLVKLLPDQQTVEKIPLDYCMYFTNQEDKKLYYIDPHRKYLVDVSLNLRELLWIEDKLAEFEEKIVKVEVRGNTLVIF